MPTSLPDHLHILAFDHRAAFWDALAIRDSPRRDALTSEAKVLIWQAFLAAAKAAGGMPSGAVLVDDASAGGVALDAAAEGVTFGMPVESSPADGLAFALGDEFGAALAAYRPSFAKVLVRSGSDAPPIGAPDVELLLRLQGWCIAAAMPWMCEIITPRHVGGDLDEFEAVVRPRRIVDAIDYLDGAGVHPDIWKVEGCGVRERLEEIAAAARRNSHDARVIVLGQGADVERVKTWLSIAAGVPGFGGFAVGRTIFGAPLTAWLAGRIDTGAAVAAMAATYTELCVAYG